MARCSSAFSRPAETSAKVAVCKASSIGGEEVGGQNTRRARGGVGPRRTKRSILLNNEAPVRKTRLDPGRVEGRGRPGGVGGGRTY